MMMLKIGDKVMWRGGFGQQAPKEATVIGIELCLEEGDKYGDEVEQVAWDQVSRCCVDLDNGHWARGAQISKMEGK